MTNYYATLGVSRDAGPDEIKRAYRKLALENHPDTTGGDDTKFKEATEAYETLSDPDKRRMYDLGGSPFASFWGDGPFSSVINRRSRGPMPSRGTNISLAVDITIEEIVEEDLCKTLTYQRNARCKTCNNTGLKPGHERTTCKTCKGTGQFVKRTSSANMVMQQISHCPICYGSGQSIADEDKCDDCSGTGQVNEERTIDIRIPRPIEDGQRIMFQGQGNCGINGGPNGVVLVTVRIMEHEIFRISDNNVILNLPITLPQAVLGCKIEIPTAYQNVIEIEVPKGTRHGDYIVKSGYGCPFFGDVKGDMIIFFDVTIPDPLPYGCEEVFKNIQGCWPETDNKSIKDYIDNVRERNV